MKTTFYNRGQGLIGIIIVLVSVILISGGLYFYLQKQIPQISSGGQEQTKETETAKTTEDLTSFIIPSGTTNGLSFLEQAEKILKIPSSVSTSEIFGQIFKQNKISNEAEIKKIINDNSQVLDLVKQASSASYFQLPEYGNLEKIKAAAIGIPRTMGNWRNMAKLIAIRAFFEAQQKQDVKAVEDLFIIIRLGHLIQNSNISLTGYLVGQDMKMNGIDLLYKLIGDGKLKTTTLKEVSDSLNKYKDTKIGLSNAFKIEYQNYLSYLEKSENIGKTFPSQLKEQYNTILAQYYRDYVNGAKIDNYSQYTKPDYISSVKDPVLKSLLDIVLVDSSRLIQGRCLQEFYIEGVSLFAIIRSNGTLPQSLDKLSPQYIKETSIDPFDGQSVRYNKDKKIIYSVGVNKQDKGGASLTQPVFFTDLKNAENPTILLSL